jgi:hypothetical protein
MVIPQEEPLVVTPTNMPGAAVGERCSPYAVPFVTPSAARPEAGRCIGGPILTSAKPTESGQKTNGTSILVECLYAG